MLLAAPFMAAAAERPETANPAAAEATVEAADSIEEVIDNVKLKLAMALPRTCAKGFYTALYTGHLSEAALYCTKGTKRTLQFVNAVIKDQFLSKISDQDAKVEITDVDTNEKHNKSTVKVKVTSHFNIDGLFDLLHIKYDADDNDKDHTIKLRCDLVKQDGLWKVTIGGEPD